MWVTRSNTDHCHEAGMVIRAVLAFVAASLLAAPAAFASRLPSSTTPLTGSTFLGGDGNQDDAAPYVDWQGLQAAGHVVHNPDADGQATAFADGSKLLEPGSWRLTTETSAGPSKVNVLDAWSAVDQPAGDTFLYLAFTRKESGGTAAISFELNHDGRLWDNGHAKIPCRRTGDLLVSTLPHGNEVELVLQRWTTTTADAATGCARVGTVKTVATVPAGTAQGAVNAGTIMSRLPGSFALGSSIPAERFSEVALNLSAFAEAAFGNRCLAFASVWMHSRSSNSETSSLQDHVAAQPLRVRSCAASGTKFFDRDTDGVRDSGDPGIPRFLIWADYDNDGVRDAVEPFSETDDDGHYVIHDIQPPSGAYTLRETLGTPGRRSQTTSWRCSFPNASTADGFANGNGGLFGCGWGPVSVASTPYAARRDFGNWVPASLTVEKQLWPTEDPGRFDLIVNGVTVLPAAGDGDSVTFPVAPGTFDISEEAAAGTDWGAFESSVSCRTVTRRRSVLRSGPVWNGLVLQAGDHATCTFVNARSGAPGIAIEKTGPTLAAAGDRLRYRLYVTNPGDLAIAANTVQVTDETCDDAPELTSKGEDGTPETLDPGDTWTYRCSYRTPAPTTDCVATALRNAATASGTVGGITVRDDASITTTLTCPDQPPEPPLPPAPPTAPEPTPPLPPQPQPEPAPPAPVVPPLPGPQPPSVPPFVPPGPAPPDAGEAGSAGVTTSTARCITRASQLQLTGQRMSRITVSVDGRRIATRTLRLLQRRTMPLQRVLAPGRHRLAIRVTFEPGSGTPPVTLAPTITVCGVASRLPRVTG